MNTCAKGSGVLIPLQSPGAGKWSEDQARLELSISLHC